MDFYETDLEVVEGAFTLGEVLHTDILPLIPIRFQLNVVLKKFHYICGCQCFYIFISEDDNSDICFYVENNIWENIRIVNKDTREIITLNSLYTSLVCSELRKITIIIYDMNRKYLENIKSTTSITLPKEATTIPQHFLNTIRVNVDGKIYDKDGNINTT
jgi:hypothetical protein